MITKSIIDRMKHGHLIQHYLLLSYAYYHLDISPVPDDVYDRLCVRLLSVFDEIDHPHKCLIDKQQLEAGTGYYIKFEDYPTIVKYAIDGYIEKCYSGDIVRLLEPNLLMEVSNKEKE